MTIRKEIQELIAFGKIPCSTADAQTIKAFEEHLRNIQPPVSADETLALANLFTDVEGDCFGLAWTLLHLIETAPIESIKQISKKEGLWFSVIKERLSTKIL